MEEEGERVPWEGVEGKRGKAEKICEVCGAPSLGHNFGAVSCESCKAFFRRNAFRLQEFSCAFQDVCRIDSLTRRFCQKCRLKKCLKVGMKREWEMVEGEKKGRSSREAKRKRPQATVRPSWRERSNDKEEKEEDGPEQKSLAEVIEVAIRAEYQDAKPPPLGRLNDREQAKLNELYMASRSLAEPVDQHADVDFLRYINEPSLISVINLTDLAIKRIIKMAKQISAFSRVCQEDQVCLLKGGCTELMILRSVVNFDSEQNAWQIPGSSDKRVLSMDVLKEASRLGVNLYEEHKRFVSSFHHVWRQDENIMLLLSAIALFTPDRANVIHVSGIKAEQDGYFYLLRRYLETLYPGCQATEIYLQLIRKLLDLRRLNESHVKLFMEVNPGQIEPLLREMFDLSQPRQK